MEVVSIEELNPGDIILINGWEDDEIYVVTIDKVNVKENLIVPEELGGLDYTPDDYNSIVRLGSSADQIRIKIFTPLAGFKK
mgnify:CR=1 FL=1